MSFILIEKTYSKFALCSYLCTVQVAEGKMTNSLASYGLIAYQHIASWSLLRFTCMYTWQVFGALLLVCNNCFVLFKKASLATYSNTAELQSYEHQSYKLTGQPHTSFGSMQSSSSEKVKQLQYSIMLTVNYKNKGESLKTFDKVRKLFLFLF